ncbi:MAG: rRNA pseudouridine synthase [Oscillospiraceae bacterium]|nr:rRNA pseudouridine synthase [Oscillospiraceae bacterium]
MAEKQRIDKLVASSGKYTRSEVKKLIRAGLVLVDGIAVRSGDEKADPETVEIRVKGEVLTWRRFTWLMMNKPAGLLSATEDGRQKTVLDLLPQELQRQELFPVGRLDKDTEGLLLLTNDGATAHELLSPKKHVDKVYYTRTAGWLTEADCQRFREGIHLDDGLDCLPAELEIITAGEESEAYVTLREGKFHQVKRMLAYCGKPVLYLKRVSMGNLTLDPALEKGCYRFLTEDEVNLLCRK